MLKTMTRLYGNHLVDLNLLPDGAVIIDAGACVGGFMKDIEQHVNSPHFYAIEPDKDNVKELIKANLEQTVIIQAALTERKIGKKAKFYLTHARPEWGSITDIHNSGDASYEVDTITLKRLIDGILFHKIHYLKMEIEGAESGVVHEMNESTANRIIQISMELHDANSNKLRDKLESLGYETEYFDGELYAIRNNKS